MLNRAAEEQVKTAPWVAIFPGMAIFLGVFGFNFLETHYETYLTPS